MQLSGPHVLRVVVSLAIYLCVALDRGTSEYFDTFADIPLNASLVLAPIKLLLPAQTGLEHRILITVDRQPQTDARYVCSL